MNKNLESHAQTENMAVINDTRLRDLMEKRCSKCGKCTTDEEKEKEFTKVKIRLHLRKLIDDLENEATDDKLMAINLELKKAADYLESTGADVSDLKEELSNFLN